MNPKRASGVWLCEHLLGNIIRLIFGLDPHRGSRPTVQNTSVRPRAHVIVRKLRSRGVQTYTHDGPCWKQAPVDRAKKKVKKKA